MNYLLLFYCCCEMDDADDGDWNLDCVELEILDNVRRTSVDGLAFLTHDS